MDQTADQRLKDNYPGEKKRRGIFRRLMVRAFLVLGWMAVGIACLLLVVFVFQRYRKTPMSLLSGFKSGPKIFRAKIPEEVKIAQHLFRGKITAVDQPVNRKTKIETTPLPAKAALAQPAVASPEKSEPA